MNEDVGNILDIVCLASLLPPSRVCFMGSGSGEECLALLYENSFSEACSKIPSIEYTIIRIKLRVVCFPVLGIE